MNSRFSILLNGFYSNTHIIYFVAKIFPDIPVTFVLFSCLKQSMSTFLLFG